MGGFGRHIFLIGGFFVLLAALLKLVDMTLYAPSGQHNLTLFNTQQTTPSTQKMGMPQAPAKPEEAPTARLNQPEDFSRAAVPETPQTLTKYTLTIFGHNPTFGPTHAPLELVVFLNPACQNCRAEYVRLKEALEPYKNKLRIVLKFLPEGLEEAEQNDAAVFSQLALGHGVFPLFWENLLATTEPTTVRHLVGLLEKSGVPFEKQRAAIISQMSQILPQLQENLTQANGLNLGEVSTTHAMFFLNGYALNTPPLSSEHVKTYATNLLLGESPLSAK